MLAIVGGCVLFYFFIAVALMKNEVDLINEYPNLEPRGGRLAIVTNALAWPLALVALIVVLIVWLADSAISAWRNKP